MSIGDRLQTIIDENIGMQPTMTTEDLLTFLERHFFEQRRRLAFGQVTAVDLDHGDKPCVTVKVLMSDERARECARLMLDGTDVDVYFPATLTGSVDGRDSTSDQPKP